MLSLPPHIVQDQISKIFTDPMEFTLTKEEGQANNVNFPFFLSFFGTLKMVLVRLLPV